VLPFDDVEQAVKCRCRGADGGRLAIELMDQQEAERATGGRRIGACWSCDGVSIDTRTFAQAICFVALKDVRDGHDFVGHGAGQRGRGCIGYPLCRRRRRDCAVAGRRRCCSSAGALGVARVCRTHGQVVAGTGQRVGKPDQDAARDLAGSGRAHASVDSYNNTGACADARADACRRIRRDRVGMKPLEKSLAGANGAAA